MHPPFCQGMSEEYGVRLEQGASIITWIFIVEMAIKLRGLGCTGYWADRWNVLDGSIVMMSIVEMIVTSILAGMGGVNLSYLRMLRMLRVMRILRLMRSWRGLYVIISTFVRVIPQLANLVILILLTMFMFALLGKELFGGMYNPSTGYSLVHTDGTCVDDVCPDGLYEKPPFHFDCAPAGLDPSTSHWVPPLLPTPPAYPVAPAGCPLGSTTAHVRRLLRRYDLRLHPDHGRVGRRR